MPRPSRAERLPLGPDAPLIFLKIQGYNDPRIYWRLLREIALCYEQRADEGPILAVVLFLDARLAPPVCQIAFKPPSMLLSVNPADCLSAIRGGGGALNVLRARVVESVDALLLGLGRWKAELEALESEVHHLVIYRLRDYDVGVEKLEEMKVMELAQGDQGAGIADDGAHSFSPSSS